MPRRWLLPGLVVASALALGGLAWLQVRAEPTQPAAGQEGPALPPDPDLEPDAEPVQRAIENALEARQARQYTPGGPPGGRVAAPIAPAAAPARPGVRLQDQASTGSSIEVAFASAGSHPAVLALLEDAEGRPGRVLAVHDLGDGPLDGSRVSLEARLAGSAVVWAVVYPEELGNVMRVGTMAPSAGLAAARAYVTVP